MPTICVFRGIKISLYWDDYTPPHFHASYGRKNIINVIPKEKFTLLLTFDNREQRVYDARPLIRKNTVFEPFMEIEAFRRVYIDELGAICWDIDPTVDSREVWNNKVDISADCCYVYGLPV